jgi:hypothetical protein
MRCAHTSLECAFYGKLARQLAQVPVGASSVQNRRPALSNSGRNG